MIELDGSTGHGGGQIIRTAAALSVVTGKAFKITNIRAKRPNPGLRPQHLTGIKALAELCDGKLTGAEVGSTDLEFVPGKIRAGKLKIDTGTAGSISLVLQTLMIPACLAPGKVELAIKGGTDVKWSPPIDYLRYVLLPLLAKSGYKAEITVERRGYYPEGGGVVHMLINPSRLKPPELIERTGVVNIKGVSNASDSLKKFEVAERQARSARKILFDGFGLSPEIDIEYSNTTSTGSGIVLWIETENSIIGASALGEKGKPAERVGRSAALELVEQYQKGVVDEWCADQLIPYMALADGGKIMPSKITEHCKTNILVTELFTGKKFIVENNIISLANLED